MSPEHCQGPPIINKVKQFDIVLSFKVSLFIRLRHGLQRYVYDTIAI